MDVPKKCQICSRRIASFTCRMCGSLVCKEHYDADKNVCINCSSGKTI